MDTHMTSLVTPTKKGRNNANTTEILPEYWKEETTF